MRTKNELLRRHVSICSRPARRPTARPTGGSRANGLSLKGKLTKKHVSGFAVRQALFSS